MLNTFIRLNRRAIISGFKWMSMIFSSIVILVFVIVFIKSDPKPTAELMIIVILSAGIGIPIIGTLIGFQRWSWGYKITRRNFNSAPFNQLDQIGFQKQIKNKNSKFKFINEFYTGMIENFIVDCIVDTENDHKNLRFIFYAKRRQLNNEEHNRIKRILADNNGVFDFNGITKKYNYKNHRLNTIQDLTRELIDFAKMIKHENIEPDDIARR